MKAFFKVLAHAAVGGFAAGFMATGVGASPKASMYAGGMSALTSVVSLFAAPPANAAKTN